jgi:hypothetical protein
VGGVWLGCEESIVIALLFIGSWLGTTASTVGRVLFVSVTKSIVGELEVIGKDISAVTGESV